ncbi:hypothetical protein LguiB_022514 [Lonicera macranthoides]
MAARVVTVAHVVSITPSSSSFTIGNNRRRRKFEAERPCSQFPSFSSSSPLRFQQTATLLTLKSIIPRHALCIVACLPPTTPNTTFNSSTKLYVSGLSFRTTEESLRNAFQNFGQLVEVNLVMDRIANRPRGFAFLRYATEEESKKAIEGMHGKVLLIHSGIGEGTAVLLLTVYMCILMNYIPISSWGHLSWYAPVGLRSVLPFLDGRVIFVEVAKPRSETRRSQPQNPRQY